MSPEAESPPYVVHCVPNRSLGPQGRRWFLGQIYGYRAQGPYDPANGMRFDPAKVLLDPYGRAVVVPKNYSRDAARGAGDNAATAMKSIVVDPSTYDWEGDTPLKHPSSATNEQARTRAVSARRMVLRFPRP